MLHDMLNQEAQESQTAGSFYKYAFIIWIKSKLPAIEVADRYIYRPSFDPFGAFPVYSCTQHSVHQFKRIFAQHFYA